PGKTPRGITACPRPGRVKDRGCTHPAQGWWSKYSSRALGVRISDRLHFGRTPAAPLAQESVHASPLSDSVAKLLSSRRLSGATLRACSNFPALSGEAGGADDAGGAARIEPRGCRAGVAPAGDPGRQRLAGR